MPAPGVLKVVHQETPRTKDVQRSVSPHRARSSRQRSQTQEGAQRPPEARKALRRWKKKDGDWKAFVSKKTGLSVKFITRATNKGELKGREK